MYQNYHIQHNFIIFHYIFYITILHTNCTIIEDIYYTYIR